MTLRLLAALALAALPAATIAQETSLPPRDFSTLDDRGVSPEDVEKIFLPLLAKLNA